MSFQGDVGGIGLADLLQSLSRGRDGVLHLSGEDGLRAVVGVQKGLLHLLPESDEDPEFWRSRVRNAFAAAETPAIDLLHMTQVARSARLEAVYALLDASVVHFRFAPGAIPAAPKEGALRADEPGASRNPRRDAVYVAPFPMEALLLEYARLVDDLARVQGAYVAGDGEVPFASGLCVDAKREHARFVEACDGTSSVQEISDRLGVPLRQGRLWCAQALEAGDVYLSSARDLWALAQHELSHGRVVRGAARLATALAASEPGPLDDGLARQLDREWSAGRLEPALKQLPRKEHRRFLMKLDPAAGAPVSAAERAQAFVKLHPLDELGALHALRCAANAGSGKHQPSVRELCSLARRFLDRSRRLAAEPVLRLAAQRAGESAPARFEIGQLMLEAGMAHEAAPWIVETARDLLAQKKPAKALPALRSLVDMAPENAEARELLSKARSMSVRLALVKKNTLVGAALVLVFASAGVVQWRGSTARAAKLEQVHAAEADPEKALRLLGALLPGDDDEEVVRLRGELEQRVRKLAEADCDAWRDEWKSAALACSVGDLQLALDAVLGLRPAPRTLPGMDPLPLVVDLYQSIETRTEALLHRLPEVVGDGEEELAAEAHLARLLDQLRSRLAASDRGPAAALAGKLAAQADRLAAREVRRKRDEAERELRSLQERQQLLITRARAYAKNGDWRRAAEEYDRLLALDADGLIGRAAAKEVATARGHRAALERAEELALGGDHAQAASLLATEFPGERRDLPWKLESEPAGARVLCEDGIERATPVLMRSAPGELLRLTLVQEGCEALVVETDKPVDRLVRLSRKPQRSLAGRARVEAAPVRVGDDDTIVADRAGVLSRIDGAGRVVWQHDLASMGGVKRTPRFLPARPGTLFVCSEDGEAWLVDARSGSAEGPLAVGARPSGDTWLGEKSVQLAFEDGRVLAWTDSLEPAPAAEAPQAAAQRGAETFTLLHRRTMDQRSLQAPQTGALARVEGDIVHVERGGKPAWQADLDGASWEWIAWETPSARAPRGRLWISDKRSVRAIDD